MKYYSEDTVRDIINGVAHASEQSENYADAILQNKPNIEIKEPHGRIVDADSVKKIIRNDVSSDCAECVGYTCGLIDEIPTVLDASTEERKK